jgi:hypothetical protein
MAAGFSSPPGAGAGRRESSVLYQPDQRPLYKSFAVFPECVGRRRLNGNVERVDVRPFHTLGAAKYAALGLDYPCAEVSPSAAEQTDRVRAVFTAAGLHAV